jgi:hypothetical protein
MSNEHNVHVCKHAPLVAVHSFEAFRSLLLLCDAARRWTARFDEQCARVRIAAQQIAARVKPARIIRRPAMARKYGLRSNVLLAGLWLALQLLALAVHGEKSPNNELFCSSHSHCRCRCRSAHHQLNQLCATADLWWRSRHAHWFRFRSFELHPLRCLRGHAANTMFRHTNEHAGRLRLCARRGSSAHVARVWANWSWSHVDCNDLLVSCCTLLQSRHSLPHPPAATGRR